MSYYEIQPLPAHIYREALEHNITGIRLNFEGGSDEGNLEIDLESDIDLPPIIYEELDDKIQSWADEVYEFSGAGEGIPYGFKVFYNFTTNKVILTEWQYEYAELDQQKIDLSLDKNEH